MKKLILAVSLLLSLISPSEAATINAASCNSADITAALAAAAAGDTVSLPAGNCTWSSSVTIPTSSVSIVGCGSSIGGTVITVGPGTGLSVTSGINNVRITAIRWLASSASAEPIVVGTVPRSAAGNQNIRIDSSYFRGAGVPIRYQGHCTGVVDHNTFDGISDGGDGIKVQGDNAGAWSRGSLLGTDDFVFFEDNVFNGHGTSPNQVLSISEGGRMVVRYNTFNEAGSGHWTDVIDVHGNGHGSDMHSGRAFEIYNNTFAASAGSGYGRAMHIGGGTGVVYNNAFEGSNAWTDFIQFRYYRANPVCAGGAVSAPIGSVPWHPYTYCEGGEGYPCWEQQGRGNNGSLEPIYTWNNTFEGTEVQPLVSDCSAAEIQQNRDYYVGIAMPGYASYAYPHPLASESARLLSVTGNLNVTASVSGGNGILACTSPVPFGETTSCHATPDSGFHTSGISGCGGSWLGGNIFITGPITFDCTVTATFSQGNESGVTCLISTSAHGSAMNEDVQLLREFRNKYLLASAPGRLFVKLYYACSPSIAHYIAQRETARTLTRMCLMPLVYAVKYLGAACVLFILLAGVIIYRILRSWHDA